MIPLYEYFYLDSNWKTFKLKKKIFFGDKKIFNFFKDNAVKNTFLGKMAYMPYENLIINVIFGDLVEYYYRRFLNQEF